MEPKKKITTNQIQLKKGGNVEDNFTRFHDSSPRCCVESYLTDDVTVFHELLPPPSSWLADSDAADEGSFSGINLYIDLKQDTSLSSLASTFVINSNLYLLIVQYIVIVNLRSNIELRPRYIEIPLLRVL